MSEAPALGSGQEVSNSKSLRWRRLAVTIAVLIAVAAIPALKYRSRFRSDAGSIKSIVVLPLNNFSGDPAQDYFAAGLTDELTTQLTRLQSLRIISRTSAIKYKDKPLAQIARELDVDAVIEGSVVREGNRARITAQLINARADKHLWAASYNCDLRDILTLQSQIAATIARQIQITLTPRLAARLAMPTPVDPQAFDLYQRGRYHAFSNNRQELAAAIALLEQAVRLDPNLASGYALLARAYRNEEFLFDPQNPDWGIKARDALNHALQLDPDLADAYLIRGVLSWSHQDGFPHERAIADERHAVELEPNLAEGHHELGKIYMHIGLFDRAEQELRTALQLDPTNAGVRYRIAVTQLDEGKLEEARAGLEGSRVFSPELWAYQMSFALFRLGRKQEAVDLIRDYLRANPSDEGGVGNAMQALLYADEGKSSLAEKSIQAAIQKGKDFGHFHHAAYTIGAAYAVMNRPNEAVRWLSAAADDGFPCYPLYESDPIFQNIRHYPGFVELISRMRKDWERRRATL